MIREFINNIIPAFIRRRYRAAQQKKLKEHVRSLPKLSYEKLEEILRDELGLKTGDNVFVHSSMDRLNLDFPFYQALSVLRTIVGDEGTLIFPTYPELTSYKFLKAGHIFDINKTPSYTGILSEFARRQKKAVRSLHPTKSVAAIGPAADEITTSHHLSPYPYDFNSPYYKICEMGGKIIGIGVMTTYLSAVHSIDDTLKERFPVNPYHPELFNAECVDTAGNTVIVKTYAHNMKKMNFDLPKYFADINDKICRDIDIEGMKFFSADAGAMYKEMRRLAENGITIYSKKYKK
ncbi:MAG: AAC(3) family N-acetyltransferase [Candidatus Kapaibacterium sp.]